MRRLARLRIGWTQWATESGVSRQTLMNWHRGRTKPDQHKAKAAMDALERLEKRR